MNASVHPEASNQPIAVNSELHSSNQQQSMDKPTAKLQLDCGITISTITDSDIETVETASAHVVPETENFDHSNMISVI